MANLVCSCGCWFDEGVCPSCGKSQATKRAKPKRGTLKEIKFEQERAIQADIARTPGAAEFKAFVKEMFDDYGISQAPTVFRNIRAGYCKRLRDGRWQVVMGWDRVEFFIEYPTWSWLWDSEFNASIGVEGPKATWACAIHEVAHAIQGEAGGIWRGRGGHHNSIWATKVQELQQLYPFESFEAKYK